MVREGERAHNNKKIYIFTHATGLRLPRPLAHFFFYFIFLSSSSETQRSKGLKCSKMTAPTLNLLFAVKLTSHTRHFETRRYPESLQNYTETIISK